MGKGNAILDQCALKLIYKKTESLVKCQRQFHVKEYIPP